MKVDFGSRSVSDGDSWRSVWPVHGRDCTELSVMLSSILALGISLLRVVSRGRCVVPDCSRAVRHYPRRSIDTLACRIAWMVRGRVGVVWPRLVVTWAEPQKPAAFRKKGIYCYTTVMQKGGICKNPLKEWSGR